MKAWRCSEVALSCGLILSAVAVFVIERQLLKAGAFALAGSVLTFFGFIHGEAIGVGQTPLVASSYLAVAILLIACAKFAVPVPKPAETAELEAEHAR